MTKFKCPINNAYNAPSGMTYTFYAGEEQDILNESDIAYFRKKVAANSDWEEIKEKAKVTPKKMVTRKVVTRKKR